MPGHMVLLALIYSMGGSALAFMLGRPLVQATDDRQGREADFRFALAHARANSEALALARAEPQERAALSALFGALGQVWTRQTSSLRSLLLFSVGFAQFAPVLPILVTTPRYLLGGITLGALVQTAQAFQQVTQALAWPVDNAQRLAEWRASAERVLGLQSAIEALRTPGRASLHCVPLEAPDLMLENLVLHNPDGTEATQPIFARLAPGEGALLTGDPQGAALLCKAVAGHWRWGEGCIHTPAGAEIAILIARPWLPQASLAELLGSQPEADTAPLLAALQATGLEHLAGQLATRQDWEAALTDADRQRLAFARLLLRKPAVVLLDHATSALTPDAEAALLATLRAALPQSIMLLAGRLPAGLPGFARTLDLRTPGAPPPPPPPPPARGITAWLRRGFGSRL